MIDTAKLKRLRRKLGLSQAKAAKRAGFKGRSRWCDVETGRRDSVSVATLKKFAKAVGVPARDLLR